MGQQILNTIKEQGYCIVRNVIDIEDINKRFNEFYRLLLNNQFFYPMI